MQICMIYEFEHLVQRRNLWPHGVAIVDGVYCYREKVCCDLR